jgi:hypothetical protein
VLYGVLPQAVVLDFDDGLPVENGGVLKDVKRGGGGAVQYYIKVVILFEALGGVVLVRGEGDVAGVSAAFDFDEADVNGGLRVFRVGFSRDQVKAAILGLDALRA